MIEVRPSGLQDWYIVDWSAVWDRFRLAPTDLPGVRELRSYNGRAPSKYPPFPHEVHRTLLPVIDAEAPAEVRVHRLDDTSTGVTLRGHQVSGIDFIRARRGTLLADEQRVGKTPTIMYAYEPERGPMLVVGPLAARQPWSEWAHRRFGACAHDLLWQVAIEDAAAEGVKKRKGPGSCPMCERLGSKMGARPSFMALEGRTYRPDLVERFRPQVMFVTFQVASTWRELSLSLLGCTTVHQLGMLVIDEAHLAGMQNRKSLTNESIRWLNSLAYRTVCATGTPLFNKPQGMWPLLDLCAPAAFGPFWDCARRYFGARPTEHGWRAEGLSNEREFRRRLSEIMLRRTWKEVATDLPPITRSIEQVALTQRQRDEVEEWAAQLRAASGGAKTAVGILARLRRLFAEVKLAHGIEVIMRTLADGHSVIAWVWHTDIAGRLYEKLVGAGFPVFGPITGAVVGADRERILDAARSHVELPRVLIANIAALGTAVNLAWATHEIFIELDWNPPNVAQAEMRPFDGTHPVSATYLVADCDTDEALVEALIAKLEKQGALGLRAGVGDIADVLRRTFRLEDQSLTELAALLVANAEGEV